MHEGEVSALLGLAGIPAVAESTMIARDCALALYEEGRIHVQHLSARESVEAIERAKAAGTQVTCEATPHHLLLTDESVRSLDTNLKMHSPLRAETDRQALIDGLRSGAIDCVATDHAPHAREEKDEPFELAPMGVTGLETAFAALHTGLVLPGVIDLGLLVHRMTAGGEPFGIPVPSLEPGSVASICIADLDAEWEVGEAGYESRSANCAFAGHRLTGRIRMTIADGAVAYRERSFALSVAAPDRGARV
jgi:dihydroorotase